MAKHDQTLGDFHKPNSPQQHPKNSMGNQQIWNEGKQVGAVEYEVTKEGKVDVVIRNSDGDRIA